jgi:hypothetical protein
MRGAPEELDFDEIDSDLANFAQDGVIREALSRGVDLRSYARSVDGATKADLRAHTLELRLYSARQLASAAADAYFSNKKLLLEELLGSSGLDEVCGDRLHVEVLRALAPVFKLVVQEGRWNQALTLRLWLSAQGRHSSEQAAIFAQLALVAGFVAAGAPPLATAPANPFLTPVEILPEWYLFPAFNVLRVRPSKAAGVASVLALLAALASAPLDAVALGAFAQNPFRRAASCGSCLVLLELALLTSLGAPEEIEFATPWL